MSYEEFANAYFETPFTVFLGIRRAVLNSYTARMGENLVLPHYPGHVSAMLRTKQSSNKVYELFLGSLNLQEKYKAKWNRDLAQEFSQGEWEIINGEIKLFNPKQKWMQYRIIHRIISTNEFLFKIGVEDSKSCTFCGEEDETLVHLFGGCREVRLFIGEVTNWARDLQVINRSSEPSMSEIVLGGTRNTNFAKMMMHMKYFIY